MADQIIVTVSGVDKVGIVAEVTAVLAKNEVNIEDIKQTLMQGHFVMFMLCDIEKSTYTFKEIKESLITCGISTKDINPSTMESKIIKNLYFAGEVLDLDALTGGYNLQIAWSTGALAGKSINKEE